jgi:hypothetical protein
MLPEGYSVVDTASTFQSPDDIKDGSGFLSLDISSSQIYGSLEPQISTGDINCEHVSQDIRKCDDSLIKV